MIAAVAVIRVIPKRTALIMTCRQRIFQKIKQMKTELWMGREVFGVLKYRWLEVAAMSRALLSCGISYLYANQAAV